MTLQEIKEKFKKKSWLRLCTLHNLNKWDLISLTNEPVYPGKYLIRKAPPVANKQCRICGTQFDIGIHKNEFIALKECTCGADGTTNTTIQKLEVYYPRDMCRSLIDSINAAKKKGFPNTIEYWINLGYDLNTAKLKVKEVQTSRSNKSPATRPGARGYSIRTVEYWIKQGFSEDAAILKVRESQTTNGLDFYIRKYGIETGPEKFNERIRAWLNAPNNKAMIKGRSKKSIVLFEAIGIGYYGSNEKTVRGKSKVHRVDFLYNNKIIEFFGDYWHGNPKKYQPNYLIRKKKVEDVWIHDRKKIEDLCSAGYDVLKIWESDYCNSPDDVLKLCKDFINDKIDDTYCNPCELYRRIQKN